MGRLIYADKLQGEFDEIITHLESTGVKESISKEEFLKCLKLLQGCIDEQPTAYDMDKVVDMCETKVLGKICIGCGYLKDNVCTYKGCNCGVSKPMYDGIKKVFEEIREGGVND